MIEDMRSSMTSYYSISSNYLLMHFSLYRTLTRTNEERRDEEEEGEGVREREREREGGREGGREIYSPIQNLQNPLFA